MLPERRTAVDFFARLVNPVLVMMMVGSLAFLLQESFYRGDFPMRLRWVSGLFVFAAVLIAWITIEMGRVRAGLYLSPLLILGVVALDRFVETHILGIPALTTVFHVIVVVSIWLVCHHVMLDCLLLDEDAAPSGGKGLLEEWASSPVPQASAEKEGGSQNPSEKAPIGERENVALGKFWDRVYPERPQGPPGRTVLYVLLGGLLVIAVAGLNGPAQGTAVYAATYVASGLGLLMTTSLLQLRLYLRQRDLAMPGDAVRGWGVVGGAVIVGVLLLAWLLPKPAVPTWSWGVYLKSPLRKASAYAARAMEPANTPTSKNPAAAASRKPSERQASTSVSGNTQSQEPTSGAEKAGGGKNDTESEGDGSGESKNDPARGRTAARETGPESSRNESKSGGAKAEPTAEPSQSSSPQRTASERNQSREGEREVTKRSPDGGERSEDERTHHTSAEKDQVGPQGAGQSRAGATATNTEQSSESQTNPTSEDTRKKFQQSLPQVSLNQVASGFAFLLRLLIALAFVVAAAWLAWRYRHEVREVLRQWCEQLMRLMESLFGRRKAAGGNDSAAGPALSQSPPFSRFQDPFASGMAARQAPVWLVVYSFDALQAWGEQMGMPRDPDETPKEYARRLRASGLRGPNAFDRLSELYNLAAYAGRSGTLSLSPEDRQALATAWRYMTHRVNEPAVAGGQVGTE
ncbi:DUF4129 domain-containing protein [Thermopirellula anaerolimosa]